MQIQITIILLDFLVYAVLYLRYCVIQAFSLLLQFSLWAMNVWSLSIDCINYVFVSCCSSSTILSISLIRDGLSFTRELSHMRSRFKMAVSIVIKGYLREEMAVRVILLVVYCFFGHDSTLRSNWLIECLLLLILFSSLIYS